MAAIVDWQIMRRGPALSIARTMFPAPCERTVLLRRTFAEHERQEAAVRSSRLDWTIVRAGALTDGERTGSYRHGFPPSECSIEFEISRADVAAFTIGLLADGTYLRESAVRVLLSVIREVVSGATLRAGVSVRSLPLLSRVQA